MKPTDSEYRELLISLFRELRQAERSAELHARREGERLTGAPLAALTAVSAHATGVNRALPELLRAEKLPLGRVGSAVGALFSTIREAVADRLVEHERSYRGTLLGLRHGLDTVRMIRHVADACGRVEIGGFCTRWIAEREPLIAQVEHAMSWFAHHPKRAVARATSAVPAT